MSKHRGKLPLCWRVRIQRRGTFESTLTEPMTLTDAQRMVDIVKANKDSATLEEIQDATARHRAIINARRTA